MRARIATHMAAFLLYSCLASLAAAQPAAPAIDEFGTQDGIDLWIPASSFVGGNGGWENWDSADYAGGVNIQLFFAHVPLPQGAYIDSWRAFYYDNDPTYNVEVTLYKLYDDITATPTLLRATYGQFVSSGTPGYTNHHQVEGFTIDLREPAPGSGVTRAQAADFYSFEVLMPGSYDVRFKGVRVVWHRQVSPAPAAATFNDVPTSDPGFQYIEALVASGITAGCGGSNYCPDATLTRRQMAVFLAKALGLHWPPF
jgi:hypothetical protein